MIGWQIFVHALRMVFGNFKQVLQITIGPALIAVAAMIVMALMTRGSSEPVYYGAEGPPPDLGGGLVLPVLVAFLIVFAIFLWVAVAWHRYVLLEEYPNGLLPTLKPIGCLPISCNCF